MGVVRFIAVFLSGEIWRVLFNRCALKYGPRQTERGNMRILFFAAIAAGIATSAAAQDPVHDWSGFYLGADLGYISNGRNLVVSGRTSPYSLEGKTAGIRAGQSWQSGSVVLGIEGDVAISSADARSTAGALNSATVDMKSLGSLRARMGYELLPNTLIYGTAGIAFSKVDYAYSNGVTSSTHREWETGFTVGAGVEHAFDTKWSVSMEYRYTDLGERVHVGPSPFTADTFTHPLQFNTVRVGLNYKF